MVISESLNLISFFLEFHPRILLKKCDCEKQKIARKSSSVRKRAPAYSLRVSAEPKEIRQPENTEYGSTMDGFDASSLLYIKIGKPSRTWDADLAVLKSSKTLSFTVHVVL